jgi:hypothetical protein
MVDDRLLRRIKLDWPDIHAAILKQGPRHGKVAESHESKGA